MTRRKVPETRFRSRWFKHHYGECRLNDTGRNIYLWIGTKEGPCLTWIDYRQLVAIAKEVQKRVGAL